MKRSKHKDYTTLKVTLSFSDEVMHAGAVSIIAGATTAIRLRSSKARWFGGEMGVRAGSSAATVVAGSLIVGHDNEADLIREVGLPVVGLGVDHMRWE
jgi:hypothetical protein